jgi:RNA polymerase sigma-70 factor (family 1)
LKERNLYKELTLKEIFAKLSESPDRALYNFFFDKYYPKMIWFALIFVKNHNAAEEVVSDVLLSIFKKREKIAKSNNIEGYIFISVKNQSLKYLKKNKRQVYFDNFESEADLLMTTSVSPEFEILENEFYNVIKVTLDSLPPKRRLVFRMIKEEGLKYQEVARLLDLSVKTVETHMGLALKTLHQNIEKYKKDEFEVPPIHSLIY